MKRTLFGLFGALVAFLCLAVTAQAQTATAEWSGLGVGTLTPAPNPGAVTASDGTSVALSYAMAASGGGVVPGFGGSYVSYYTASIGGVSPSLLINMDNDAYDANDKVTLDITLGRAVSNLAFTLADVDRDTFRDTIEVLYDTGDGIWINAANTPGFWTLGGGNVQRVNNGIANGWRGQGSAGNADTNANIAFNFGATAVERIRIRYFSYTGTGNPSAQYIALSRLTFAESGNDLSLAKSLLTASPVYGGAATFRLTVTSAASSDETATGIAVRDLLPTGFEFASASGTGSYDAGTGVWSVGSLAPGSSASIDITGTVLASAGAVITNTAEIIASSAADPDSTPDNGATGEDDYANASLTVSGARVAGTAPTLTCTAGSVVWDWTGQSWTAGSTDNTYALSALGNIRFEMANPGTWLSSPTYGGLSPILQTANDGGSLDASVIELVDLANRTSEVTTTITLPAAMAGAQFRLFDVDFASGQFADRVQVVGRLGGVDVLPQLTNGVSNYVIGNNAYGDGASANGSANGNITVTFTSPIDSIEVRYGNHSLAPANPGQQAITLHDITFCNPVAIPLNVTKLSQVLSDPVSGTTNPKAVPGAVIGYCITIGNPNPVAATNIAASDPLPAGTAYELASLASGTSCAAAGTSEDDDASGADDTDAVGANWSGSAVGINIASLAAGASVAVTFRAVVN